MAANAVHDDANWLQRVASEKKTASTWKSILSARFPVGERAGKHLLTVCFYDINER
jgi:hypothetical protein